MMHAEEMVLPQTFASGLRSAVSGGGGTGGGTSNNAFHYSPTFSGTGASMAGQASRDFEGFGNRVIGMFRNGQLKVPGRA